MKFIALTENQAKWLEAHFAHTRNEEICARFGISDSTLHRIARDLGLKKSPQFIHEMRLRAGQKAREAVANEDEEARERRKENARQNGVKGRFKPGVNPNANIPPERMREITAKRVETWKKNRREDLIRGNWGFPRQTKHRMPRHEDPAVNKVICAFRWYLRRRGYEIPERSGMVVYVTETTNRSSHSEAHAKKLGFRVREK